VVFLEKRKKKRPLGRKNVGGRILLNPLFKFEWQEVKSTGLSQNGDNNCAFVITVLKVIFHKKWDEFFYFLRKKLPKYYASDYSVHKYIYRSCMSGPSNITLL
jgi:hypothetical protein